MAEPSPTPGGISAADYRDVFATVPAAVAVVATIDGEVPHGTTVSAFTALSLDPPLVLVSLDNESMLLAALRRTGRFSLNVLSVGQDRLAMKFARKGADKFDGVGWDRTPGGEHPRIAGSACWIAASVADILPGGDHSIVIGRVLESELLGGRPLVYHSRGFHDLIPVEG